MEQLIARMGGMIDQLPFVQGVVLGGSRATGTAGPDSDIDIGIYYRQGALDLPAINAVAQALDDEHRAGLVCGEGGWGNWVNCGGWLTVEGVHVDLILRDMARVEKVVEECERGIVHPHYHTGHPHAYISAMYRGELAEARLLHGDADFAALKRRAEPYPEALAEALMGFFGFEAEFSTALAQKNARNGDVYYLAGHVFRAISAMNQALFARNRRYCLNEKKAIFRIDAFEVHPENYARRVNAIVSHLDLDALAGLCTQCQSLLQR